MELKIWLQPHTTIYFPSFNSVCGTKFFVVRNFLLNRNFLKQKFFVQISGLFWLCLDCVLVVLIVFWSCPVLMCCVSVDAFLHLMHFCISCKDALHESSSSWNVLLEIVFMSRPLLHLSFKRFSIFSVSTFSDARLLVI